MVQELEEEDSPALSSATTAGSTATQRVSGFKTGRGFSLGSYKAARERAEELFAEDDMEVQTFTGFRTGKGTPITASKAAREREENFFAEDDMDDPRILKTPGHVKTVPSIQPAQSKGFKFSSGEGNALTASTRCALANPHGIHARSLELMKPGLSGNRLPSITPPEHQSFSIGASSAAPQQTAISPHMINLGLKSLRAATSGPSQPGPASTAVGVPSNGKSSTGSIAQPPNVTHTPTYTSLFHLPGIEWL